MSISSEELYTVKRIFSKKKKKKKKGGGGGHGMGGGLDRLSAYGTIGSGSVLVVIVPDMPLVYPVLISSQPEQTII